MVHVIYEWYTQSLAEREKVGRRKQPVVVLQREEAAGTRVQLFDPLFESLERGS
jgi:hypothetical protein